MYFDAGFQKMNGRRVPKHVRRDPTRGRSRRRGIETGGMVPHAFVDAEAR